MVPSARHHERGKSNCRIAIECANENADEKKPADLAVSGLNPIQGELEETGIILDNGIAFG
jgi:hypothetical protein